MGLMSRMSTVVKSKMNRLLDKAEDPSETLDYAYEKQREMLTNVKRGIVEMVTTKRRLQIQAEKARANIVTLDNQARNAMAAGREDLARLALQRKQTALMELDGLDEQIAQLELEQQKLTNAEQRLTAKVESFRSRKEIIKAQYSAAQAQVRIGSALSGISEEMGDVQLAVERAEDKTQTLRAKAGAIDELAESGVLNLDMALGGGDSLSRELAQISAEQNVESELAALRGGTPATGGALPSGGARASQPSAPADPLEAELAALRASQNAPRNALGGGGAGGESPRLTVERRATGLPSASSSPSLPAGGDAPEPGAPRALPGR